MTDEILRPSDEQISFFQREGYVILENWISEEMVERLRAIIDIEIERVHRQMDKLGKDISGINHRDSRYFIPHNHERHQAALDHTFGPEMEGVCRSFLGDEVQLFLDQLLIKAPMKGNQPGLKFGWHQDAGYISHSRPEYLTCWTALDEMSEENGTVRVLPLPRMDSPGPVDHVMEEGSNDMIGYHGDDPGILAIVPAGSVVVFSSYTFHCSGPNLTSRQRRAYLTQYSKEPIMNQEGTGLHIKAVPFLEKGEKVCPEEVVST